MRMNEQSINNQVEYQLFIRQTFVQQIILYINVERQLSIIINVETHNCVKQVLQLQHWYVTQCLIGLQIDL